MEETLDITCAHTLRQSLVISAALACISITTASFADADKEPRLIKGKFSVPLELEVVKKDWAERGFRRTVEDAKPKGWGREEHFHTQDDLTTVVSGRSETIIGGKRYLLEPGDELLIPRNTKHTHKNLHDGWLWRYRGFPR